MTPKQKLEQQLWNIANTLRGRMGADDFRDYILGFIFYKYLSEKMYFKANEMLQTDGIDFMDIDETTDKGQEYLAAIQDETLESLGYFLKPSELFSEIAKRGNGGGKAKFILDDLAKVLNSIAQSTMGTESEEDFDNLFEDMDLASSKLGKSETDKNELIVKVLTHLDAIDFRLQDSESDVLGDAYEYLIGQFASGAGKKAGEFYTPQQVSIILAKIVTTGKTRLKSVYDPTCGSGSLLLRVARELNHNKDSVSGFYGQESNPSTYNLCRMNMIMHDVHYRKFDIKNEDTLERPQHLELRFEAVVANPPFSAQWSASPLHMSDDRFSSYGKLAPKSKADFAFVQHMVYQLDENGTMAVVLPHGVLFRGAAEGHIRKYLIEDCNYLDAVIGLPANIFYGTSIPTCILVLKKHRENNKDILFIDASQHFEKAKNQNYLRSEDIEKIVTTFRVRQTEDKYSYVATLSEVKENDYNLNIPRYVDTFEEEEPVDLEVITEYLNNVDNLSKENDKKLYEYCDALNIPKPIGNNIYLLKEYKKGVMQKIFSQEIRFKDDNGQDYPDWEEKRLGEVLSVVDGDRGNDYPNGDDFNTTGYCLFLNAKNVTKKGFSFEEKSFISKEKDEILRKGKLQRYDLVLTTRGTVGNIAYYDNSVEYSNIRLNSGMVIIRAKKSNINSRYIYLLFFSHIIKNHIRKIAFGSAQPQLTVKEINKFPILLPSPVEQQKIANFLSSIDTKTNTVQSQLTQTQNFKKGLLQKMFI